jgi:hypothetical protein
LAEHQKACLYTKPYVAATAENVQQQHHALYSRYAAACLFLLRTIIGEPCVAAAADDDDDIDLLLSQLPFIAATPKV